MKCSACEKESSYVVDSRPFGDFIKRRRECSVCGHRWNTYEIQERYCKKFVYNKLKSN